MFANRSFLEVVVGVIVFFLLVVPGSLWTVFSIKAGHMVDFPATLSLFSGLGGTLATVLLAIQQFTNKPAA